MCCCWEGSRANQNDAGQLNLVVNILFLLTERLSHLKNVSFGRLPPELDICDFSPKLSVTQLTSSTGFPYPYVKYLTLQSSKDDTYCFFNFFLQLSTNQTIIQIKNHIFSLCSVRQFNKH